MYQTSKLFAVMIAGVAMTSSLGAANPTYYQQDQNGQYFYEDQNGNSFYFDQNTRTWTPKNSNSSTTRYQDPNATNRYGQGYYNQANNTYYKNGQDENYQFTGNERTPSNTDRSLGDLILQSLRNDSSLSAQAKDIRVVTIEGTVVLLGNVNSESEKSKIEAIVRSLKGVKNVANSLTIASSDETGFPSTSGTATDADRFVIQQIQLSLVNDNSLSSNAKSVQITFNQGKVTLKGTVASQNEKMRIENLAKQIKGVKTVDNKLEVTK